MNKTKINKTTHTLTPLTSFISCPRCIGGQMFKNEYGDESAYVCLQCGYRCLETINHKRAALPFCESPMNVHVQSHAIRKASGDVGIGFTRLSGYGNAE